MGNPLDELPPGTYCVTVSDAVCCTSTGCFTVSNCSEITINSTVVPASGPTAEDGSISVYATGGTAPYTFEWNVGYMGNSISGLPPDGLYCVNATDANGCEEAVCIDVSYECPPNLFTGVSTECICSPGSGGSIDIDLDSDGYPYTFQWSGPNNYTSQQEDLDNLWFEGVYAVTATNSNGCEDVFSVPVLKCPELEEVPPYVRKVRVRAELGSGNGPLIYDGEWSVSGTCIEYSGESFPFTAAPINSIGLIIDVTASESLAPLNIELPGLSLSSVPGNSSNNINWQFKFPPGIFSNFSGIPPVVQQILFEGVTPQGAELLDLRAMSSGLEECVELPGLTGECATWMPNYQTGTDDVHIFEVGCMLLAHEIIPNPSGLESGVIMLTINGGSPAYNITLSGNGSFYQTTAFSSANPIPLPYNASGTYTVKVSDGNGCKAVKTIDILPCLSSFDVQAHDIYPACPNMNNGAFCVSAFAQTQLPNQPLSFSFNWPNGINSTDTENTSCATNLSNGSYSVTVTEDNCNLYQVAHINLSYDPSISLGASILEACGNLPVGHVKLTAINGGRGPYTFNWDNGKTSRHIFGLTSGTYCVTVTDDCGATVSECYVVPSFGVNNVIDVQENITNNCTPAPNGLNGSISLNVTGDAPPFSFEWSNGESGPELEQLGAGVYTVTITDNCGKEIVNEYTIEDVNNPIAFLVSYVTHICDPNETTGAIDLFDPINPSYSYSYLWSNGSTNQDLQDLGVGSYTVTVTSSPGEGCTNTHTAEVLDIGVNPISATISTDCINAEIVGSISLSIVASDETYLWNTGSTEPSIENLSPGTYSVTVSNLAGCSDNESFEIPEMLPLSPPVAQIENTCLDQGKINIMFPPLSAGYTYEWSNGKQGREIANLTPGVYTVTMTDVDECKQAIKSFEVEYYMDPLVEPINADILNTCSNTGRISITEPQPFTDYTYEWSIGEEGPEIENLLPGGYTVTVTNWEDCQQGVTSFIVESATVEVFIVVEDIGFANPNNPSGGGYIEIGVDGNLQPFTFSWSNGAGTQNIYNLHSGYYTVTVTDGRDCSRTETYYVGECESSNPLSLETNVTPLSADGATDGTVSAIVSGGATGNLNYYWESPGNPDFPQSTYGGYPSNSILNLPEGDYYVTVTDGCSTVTGWRPVRFCGTHDLYESGTVTDICPTASSSCPVPGSINLTMGGDGIAPISYEWWRAQGPNCADLGTKLPNTDEPMLEGITFASQYKVRIADYANCVSEDCFNVQRSFETTGPHWDESNGTCFLKAYCNGCFAGKGEEDLTLFQVAEVGNTCSAFLMCPIDGSTMGPISGTIHWTGIQESGGECTATRICHFDMGDGRDAPLPNAPVECCTEGDCIPGFDLFDDDCDCIPDEYDPEPEDPCVPIYTPEDCDPPIVEDDDEPDCEDLVCDGPCCPEGQHCTSNPVPGSCEIEVLCSGNLEEVIGTIEVGHSFCYKPEGMAEGSCRLAKVCLSDPCLIDSEVEIPAASFTTLSFIQNQPGDWSDFDMECGANFYCDCSEIIAAPHIPECEECLTGPPDDEKAFSGNSDLGNKPLGSSSFLESDLLGLKVYPNPFSSEKVSIEISSGRPIGSTVTFTDIMGKIMWQGEHYLNKGRNVLNWTPGAGLQDGFYFIHVVDESGGHVTVKVVHSSR